MHPLCHVLMELTLLHQMYLSKKNTKLQQKQITQLIHAVQPRFGMLQPADIAISLLNQSFHRCHLIVHRIFLPVFQLNMRSLHSKATLLLVCVHLRHEILLPNHYVIIHDADEITAKLFFGVGIAQIVSFGKAQILL